MGGSWAVRDQVQVQVLEARSKTQDWTRMDAVFVFDAEALIMKLRIVRNLHQDPADQLR